MPELKPDHRAVLKPRQLLEQVPDLLFQLELIGAGDLRRIATAPNRATRTIFTSLLSIGALELLGGALERVLNTEEAAALLQIHPKTLQRLARQGIA